MRTVLERLRLGAAVLALAVIAAGACEQPRLISKDKLAQLVLSETDLPAGFASFYKGPQVRLDDQGTARSDPGRFGRQGGWIIRLRQSDPTVIRGLQVIESRADLFAGIEGARSDLDLYRMVLASTSGGGLENIAPPALGDEAIGISFTMTATRPVRFFRIAWRARNVTASLTVQAFEGEISLADALSLARLQQQRIETA